MRSGADSQASAPPFIDRLTRWVLAHKRLVLGFWVAMTLAGMFGAGRVGDALSQDFGKTETPAFQANAEIVQKFRSGGQGTPLVAVAKLPKGGDARSPGVRRQLRSLERDVAKALPGARIASYGSTGDRGYVSDDGRTTFLVAHPQIPPRGDPFDTIDAAAQRRIQRTVDGAQVGGAPVRLVSEELLTQSSEQAEGGNDSGVLNETLLAGLGALLVLGFVFASALAVLPLMMAVVAVPTTMLAVLGLAQVTDVSFIVLFLTALIGLGIAIDYALIVVMRWREERERGAPNEEAVAKAASTAGRAVVFSGTTVAIGLLATVVLPVPFLRSIGYGGLLIPLISVIVALTLLPVVLAKVGPRMDRRRLRRTERAERHWASFARGVLRHRWLAAVTGVAILAALISVASGMVIGSPEATDLGASGQTQRTAQTLERSGIGTGPISPIEVVAPTGNAKRIAGELAEVDGVRAASAPADWSRGGTSVVEVLPSMDTNSSAGRDTVARVVDAVEDEPGVGVGGATPQTADFIDSVYGSFPLMLALISLITFVLLARAFRSIVLPLKAIAMNIASVFATWGTMTLVWQHGFGTQELFSADPTGSVTFWVPFMVFAFIYGLSMDYEVFILSRMREEYDRTGSTSQAVIGGMASTGRLVTSAALIVFLAFGSLASTGPVDVKMLATGLAGGVLLDAVVVRALLVPAFVSLFGRWNWWFPEPARRLLGVRSPAPAQAPATA